MAFFFIPLVTVTLSGLSPDRIPAASGLSNFMRIMAGGIGASVSTTLWENRAILHHAQLSENISVTNATATQAIAGLQAQGMSVEQAYAQLTRLIDQQAFMLAANDIFYMSAIGFVALIGVVWLSRPKKGGGRGSAAGPGSRSEPPGPDRTWSALGRAAAVGTADARPAFSGRPRRRVARSDPPCEAL